MRANARGGAEIATKKKPAGRMIKSPELCELLGITRGTLEKYLDLEDFPQPQVRGRVRFWFLSEARAWLRRQPRRKSAKERAA